jgi:phenylacetate-CoA ligase
VSLTILGEGPERGRLEDVVRRLSLEARVALPGAAESPAALVAGATIMAHPSSEEALGTAVLEAMALGTPVVATDVGGVSELLEGGAGVLVPPGEPAALATAIEALLRDPLRRARLAEAAAVRVRHYDIRGMAARCSEVYRSLLDQPGP